MLDSSNSQEEKEKKINLNKTPQEEKEPKPDVSKLKLLGDEFQKLYNCWLVPLFTTRRARM